MKKIMICIFIVLLNIPSLAQEPKKDIDFEILTENVGDLDGDGIDEKVIIYETKESTEYGNVREIYIYKKVNRNWSKWHSSDNAILRDGDGGMMGDPFQDIEIVDGILNISFFGGSSWKWSYTDKYRFQNNQFELIGYTSHYFKLCEYWESDDFNLSTGKIISSKEYEKCENGDQEVFKKENETFFVNRIKINLQNRNTKEIKITTPKYGRKIYIAQSMNE